MFNAAAVNQVRRNQPDPQNGGRRRHPAVRAAAAFTASGLMAMSMFVQSGCNVTDPPPFFPAQWDPKLGIHVT